MSRPGVAVASVLLILMVAGCGAVSPRGPGVAADGSAVPEGCPAPSAAPVVPARAAGPLAPRVYAVDNHLPPGAPAGTPALVDVIDPGSNSVTATIPVSPQPHHIYPVPGTNEAYISRFVGCSMDVVDLVSNRVIGQVASGAGPRHLEFSRDGRYAYAVDYYGSGLSVIDTASNRTVAEIPTGPKPNYPAISRDGRVVYVADSGADTVTVAQATAPFAVLGTITVGAHPFDLALTPDGRTLAVANAGDDTVSFIDTASRSVTGTTGIRGPSAPGDDRIPQKTNIRITADGRSAWVGDQSGSAFSVLDIASRRLVAVLPAAAGADIFTPIPNGPAHGLAITTARYGPFVDVVDPSGPTLLDRVVTAPDCVDPQRCPAATGETGAPGTGSHQVVFDREGMRAYVSDRPGGAVTVLDLSTGRPRFLTNIATSYGAFGFPDGIAYVAFTDGVTDAGG